MSVESMLSRAMQVMIRINGGGRLIFCTSTEYGVERWYGSTSHIITPSQTACLVPPYLRPGTII